MGNLLTVKWETGPHLIIIMGVALPAYGRRATDTWIIEIIV